MWPSESERRPVADYEFSATKGDLLRYAIPVLIATTTAYLLGTRGPHHPVTVLLIASACLAVLLGSVDRATSTLTVGPWGLRLRTLFRTREVPWEDVTGAGVRAESWFRRHHTRRDRLVAFLLMVATYSVAVRVLRWAVPHFPTAFGSLCTLLFLVNEAFDRLGLAKDPRGSVNVWGPGGRPVLSYKNALLPEDATALTESVMAALPDR